MKYRISFCLCALVTFNSVAAERIVSGAAIIDYNAGAWAVLAGDLLVPQPSNVLEAFFDQDGSNTRTLTELMSDPGATASYTHQVYGMNGPVVQNLQDRTTQPTTFAFNPGKVAEHTGRIGLGGVSRFAFSGGGHLLFGDFTLQFDSSRLFAGGTGWYVQANIPPAAPLFDLLEVSVTEGPGTLAIEGELGLSFEVANFLYVTPADTLRRMGHFSFSGITAAQVEPATEVLSLSLVDGQLVLEGKQGVPGEAYTVVSSDRLLASAGDWNTVANGTFDALGHFLVRLPMDPANTAGFYQLSHP